MDTTVVSFGQWLKRQRRAHDLTQEELADRIGCALVTLRKIESDDRRPSKEIAQRIADILAVPEADRPRFIAFARAVYPDEAPPPPTPEPQVVLIPPQRAPATQRAPSPVGEGARPLRLHNLPVQLTSFVGREAEIAQILRLLGQARLLTLTGAGGSGKTRLVLQVAGRLLGALDDYCDGIWLVDLARLADPDLVPQAIASSLGLRNETARPLLDQLVDYCRGRQMLLLLDNCEHLIAATALVADTLLRAAPDLAILATSREPLAIDGELTFYVPSLQVPDPQHLPPLERAREFEAVRLFADRAATARSGFEVHGGNVAAVAEICQRLDGMPLAIELAASRTRLLSVAEIRTRLADRFALLTGGSRVALPRHQTLRATIEWSYGLLSEPEKALLRSLAVFAGGWTLDAAEQVCTANQVGAPAERSNVLDLLSHLVDKSLVVPEWRGRPDRYGMLETLRQFALEQLEAAGEGPGTRGRHAAYFVGLAEAAEPMLMSREQRAWQIRLEDEHNNIQVSLDWLMSPEAESILPRPRDEAMRLAGALWRYWEVRGHLAEGYRHLIPLVESPGPGCPPAVLARAYLGAGVCCFYIGDFPAATRYYETSAAMYRELGDRRAMTRPLTYLGWMGTYQAEFARARGQLEEALAVSREVGDLQAESWATARLGLIAYWSGDPVKGIPLLQRALALSREMGDELGTCWWLETLGMCMMAIEDLDRAEELYEEGIVRSRELGDRRDYAWSTGFLAVVWLLRGDLVRPISLFQESVLAGREIGDPMVMTQNTLQYASFLARTHPAAATRLIASCAVAGQAAGFTAPLTFQVFLDQVLSQLRHALPSDVFAASWEQGCMLPLEKAVDEVLALGETLLSQ